MSILIAYFVINQQCDFQILMPRLNDIDALSSHWYCISWVVYGVNELYVFSFHQILQKCCHFPEKKASSCFLLSSFSFSIGSRLLVKGFGVNQSSWRLLKSILEANGWQLLQFLAKNDQKRPLLTSFLKGLNLACVLLVADFWAGTSACPAS